MPRQLVRGLRRQQGLVPVAGCFLDPTGRRVTVNRAEFDVQQRCATIAFACAQGQRRCAAVARGLAVGLALVGLGGCASVPNNGVDQMVKPSNDRPWKANLAVLPSARFRGDRVKVYNVRNCSYLDEDTYVLNYDDRTYRLSDLETLDFVVCPFKDLTSLAHTMLSFGFRDGQYLAVSVEVRLEEGESYSTVGGLMRQFEIMYVVADERDVMRLRTEVRDTDVYAYRTRMQPELVRELFVDVMKRVNTLKQRPEFYDTLMNNCTTNIVAHINRVQPGTIPWDPTTLLNGYADRTAYTLGFLVDYGSFEETRRRAHINALAHQHADALDFSQKIRQLDTDRTRMVQQEAAPSQRLARRPGR